MEIRGSATKHGITRNEILHAWRNAMTTYTTDTTGLDAVSPATHPARDAAGFREIIAANEAVERAQAQLRDAVSRARRNGDSCTVIGAALGVSKQAAQQRFGA